MRELNSDIVCDGLEKTHPDYRLETDCGGLRAKAGAQSSGHSSVSEEGARVLGQSGSTRGGPLVGPFFLRTVSHPESLNPNCPAVFLLHKHLILALDQILACTI